MAAPSFTLGKIYGRLVGPLLPALVFGLYVSICQGVIPGLDAINTTIYFAAGFLFIPSFFQADRTTALTDLRRSGLSDYYVFSSRIHGNRDGNEDTWAGIKDKSYRISFYGLEQGIKNSKEVLKTMKSTPRIVWIRPATWSIIALAILILNVVICGYIVPVSGFMTAGDESFSFFSSFLYYLPSLIALGCPVLSFVFVYIRDNILYECAARIVSERKKEMADIIESGMKWYHNICPKCGAKYSASITHCISCGSSLEVVECDRNLNSIRFIRTGD